MPRTSLLSRSLERPVVREIGRVLALVCPGQGSQSPGFLAPWLELPGAADRLERLSAVASIDLAAHGTTSDTATIQDTAVAQPLIVAAGLLALPYLSLDPPVAPAADVGGGLHPASTWSAGPGPSAAVPAVTTAPAAGLGHLTKVPVAGVAAGHSVGEFTAAVAAGVLTPEQAMVLVSERGRAMAAAAAVTETGMSAVVGGDPTEVMATLERFGLTPANVNGAGQVVAAGTVEQLAQLSANPPQKARVIALKVAGAFHTHHMAPAVGRLTALTRDLVVGDPQIRLLSNADGQPVKDGLDLLARLAAQVSGPVRWDKCMATMEQLGVTALVELPPAGTLTNLAKRALSGIEVLAVKTPDDLDRARDLIKAHQAEQSRPDHGRLQNAGGTL
jgi:[acyl-carrier-protein] S-malonyltransferase